MARLKMIEEHEASPELQALYKEIKMGMSINFVPNWFKVQGANPTLVKGNWEKLKSALYSGTIPMTTKQLILYAVSAKRKCAYCIVMHGSSLIQLGVTEDVIHDIVQNIESADITEAVRSGVEVVVKTALDPMSVTDKDVKKLFDAGYSAGEVQELLAQADLVNLLNTLSDVTGIPIDAEMSDFKRFNLG